MVDGNEADDKIIAVLESDLAYGEISHMAQAPRAMVDRLKHYFLTYKRPPEAERNPIEIRDIYGRAEAHEVIRRSQEDYRKKFPDLKQRFLKALRRGVFGYLPKPCEAHALMTEVDRALEAAQALGRRIVKEGGATPEERIRFALKLCLLRPPTAEQVSTLVGLYQSELAQYTADKAAAAAAPPPFAPRANDAQTWCCWT